MVPGFKGGGGGVRRRRNKQTNDETTDGSLLSATTALVFLNTCCSLTHLLKHLRPSSHMHGSNLSAFIRG